MITHYNIDEFNIKLRRSCTDRTHVCMCFYIDKYDLMLWDNVHLKV